MILPDLATKSHAELPATVEETFVWSLMGQQDAGQSLKESSSAKKRSEEPGAIFGGALARPSETASSRKRFRMEEPCLLCSSRRGESKSKLLIKALTFGMGGAAVKGAVASYPNTLSS